MVECPKCSDEYTDLGTHWRYSPSHRPELTQKQKEIVTGLLMGDGCMRDMKNANCYLQVKMISKNYLEYLNNLFGCLGSSLKLVATAEEKAQENIDRGFSETVNENNYSDQYNWNTRSHPEFNKFREWYSSGKKVWPEDIELTPTVLKHWYVGDGHYATTCSQERIKIAMSNEAQNTEKVTNYFTNSGLPEPSTYYKNERKDGGIQCNASWTVEDSHTLWEYMGEPLPDFEYKWPEEYR
jgi:hypothetical protein